MAGKLELGKAFLSDLLSRIPEDQRPALAPLLDDETVADFAGGAVLRQQDYSREMNAVKAEEDRLKEVHRQQTEWWTANQEAVKRGVTGNPAPTPGVDMTAVEKLVAEREKSVAGYTAYTVSLAMKHFKEFNEDLDLPALLADPEVGTIGIPGAYQKKYGAKYAEKAAASRQAEIDAAVKKGVDDARKQFVSAPPYPTSPMDLSPLDALEPNKAADTHSAQAAADEYTRLVNEKQRVGA